MYVYIDNKIRNTNVHYNPQNVEKCGLLTLEQYIHVLLMCKCLCTYVQVSIYWGHYSEPYTVYNKNANGTTDDPQTVVSTFKFVGAALLIACKLHVHADFF